MRIPTPASDKATLKGSAASEESENTVLLTGKYRLRFIFLSFLLL
jgi:hypothetical protein